MNFLNDKVTAIIGLGNPGAEYQNTKHNIGFMAVDYLTGSIKSENTLIKGCRGICFTKKVYGKKIYFLKPETFMNLSGVSVTSLCKNHNISEKEILVVYDDMDLPLGRIRLRKSGGSAGHNGVQSIIDELGTKNFPRLRIGIGKVSTSEWVNHVLAEFNDEDKTILPKILELSCSAIKLSVRGGVTAAMNKFNSCDLIPKIEESDS